jgi:hypothetical protein
LLNVCKKIDEYERSKRKRIKKEFFFVSIHDNCVYINELKIIDKKAKIQFAIFKILMAHYIEDIFNDTSTYISVSQINSSLETYNIFLDDYESQIRKNIYKIRSSIKAAQLSAEDVSIIDSMNWEGYRINNQVFLRRF